MEEFSISEHRESVSVQCKSRHVYVYCQGCLSTPCPQSQYNCCKKINCGSEYPFTADLSSVSDVGD